VVDFPNDKAPGPDGFNGFFVKKTWHIIRDDLYKLCTDFYDHIADLKSINHSYITLVPKMDNPETVNDFRPISLLNTSMKIITMQREMPKVVHENQYGFIKESQYRTV